MMESGASHEIWDMRYGIGALFWASLLHILTSEVAVVFLCWWQIVRSSFSSVLLPGHQEVRAPAPAELFAMFTLFGASAPHIVRPFDLDN